MVSYYSVLRITFLKPELSPLLVSLWLFCHIFPFWFAYVVICLFCFFGCFIFARSQETLWSPFLDRIMEVLILVRNYYRFCKIKGLSNLDFQNLSYLLWTFLKWSFLNLLDLYEFYLIFWTLMNFLTIVIFLILLNFS